MKTRILSVYFLKQKQDLKEKEIRIKLLKCCYQFSPIVALDQHPLQPSTGVNLDITGSERLFVSEANLIRKLEKELRKLGFVCRLVSAPTLGAAWAISRFRKERALIIQQEELKASLEPLPLAALRISEKTITSLADVNILYIKELLRIPRAELIDRFEREITLKLNQALGVEVEALAATRFAPSLRRVKVFQHPVNKKVALIEATKELLERLIEDLKQQTKKPISICVETKATNKIAKFKTIPLTVSSLKQNHLLSLVEHYIETLEIKTDSDHHHEGIEYLALSANDTQRISAKQTPDLNEETEVSFSLGELIDSLNNRIGRKQTKQLECHHSHIPERSFSYLPFSKTPSELPQMVEAQRPSVLFQQPLLIKSMSVLPDGCPFSLSWRGAVHKIISGVGPERICPAWWDKEDANFRETRDYFRVQIDCGNWLWVYREVENSKWFVQGIWC